MIMEHGRSAVDNLRDALKGDDIVVAPGVLDPISALIAAQVGFKALYFSGGGFANSLGLPDLGMTTMSECIQAVSYIVDRVKLPLIVDADTGFGEAVNVMRTVRGLERLDVAGLHIEDQLMPKKCGQLSGKQVVGMGEMVKKIVAAKDSSRKGIVVIARTDAREVEGMDAAIERAKAYARAGADMIFPEALESVDEFKEFAKKVHVPLLANMTEFGKSPYIKVNEFWRMGYKVVIFPMTAFRASLKTMEETYVELKRSGSQEGMLDRMMTREDIYNLIDYYSYESFDSRSAGAAARFLKSR
jgi:methylisocitrate lyase